MKKMVLILMVNFWLLLFSGHNVFAGSEKHRSWTVCVDNLNQVWSVLENPEEEDLSYFVTRVGEVPVISPKIWTGKTINRTLFSWFLNAIASDRKRKIFPGKVKRKLC